jgi:hypothetical protein
MRTRGSAGPCTMPETPAAGARWLRSMPANLIGYPNRGTLAPASPAVIVPADRPGWQG